MLTEPSRTILKSHITRAGYQETCSLHTIRKFLAPEPRYHCSDQKPLLLLPAPDDHATCSQWVDPGTSLVAATEEPTSWPLCLSGEATEVKQKLYYTFLITPSAPERPNHFLFRTLASRESGKVCVHVCVYFLSSTLQDNTRQREWNGAECQVHIYHSPHQRYSVFGLNPNSRITGSSEFFLGFCCYFLSHN